MRDRREVLKLLAGGTAAAAGASLITTSSAFADGGTTSRRPTCSATSAVNWSSTATNNRLVLTLAFAATSGCDSGWTASQQYAVRVTPTSLAARVGGSNIATGGNWSTFRNLAANVTMELRTAAGSGNQNDIQNNTNVTAEIIVRRVCTDNADSAHRAWCCTKFSKTANYTRGGDDQWGGATSGSFGDGALGVSVDDGCAAP